MCLVRCHAHDPLGGGAGSYWLARPCNVICSRVSREEKSIDNLSCMLLYDCLISHSVVCNFVIVQSLTLQVFLIVFEFLCQIFAKALQGKFNTGRQAMIALILQHDKGLHDIFVFSGHMSWYFPNQVSIRRIILLFVFSGSVRVLGHLSEIYRQAAKVVSALVLG